LKTKQCRKNYVSTWFKPDVRKQKTTAKAVCESFRYKRKQVAAVLFKQKNLRNQIHINFLIVSASEQLNNK